MDGAFLEVDLLLTWAMNQERFQAGQHCLASVTKMPMDDADCNEGITPLRALVFNAVLAAYTRHKSELMQIRAAVRPVLCEGLDELRCKQKLSLFDNLIARVAPGELPLPRNPARETSTVAKTHR